LELQIAAGNQVQILIEEMEALALRIRDLVISQPPHDLLGYIYTQRLLLNAYKDEEKPLSSEAESVEFVNGNQFLLEYVHAVLASTPIPQSTSFSEATCVEIYKLAEELKSNACMFAMFSSVDTEDGVFGPNTSEIEFYAKTTWVILRGNRYQVLEEEFYSFVLAPHDALLRETYGIGANEIAKGFQDIADAARKGQSDAINEISKQFQTTMAFAESQGKTIQELEPEWVKENLHDTRSLHRAFNDMFRGGISNISQHTALPESLLRDLAYERGEETDFFSEGPHRGTPFRTLPVRKKPLIKLDNDYYATDPCFIRDAGYRALLWNLLNRKPEYKRDFENKQKCMSEAAFFKIFDKHLESAAIYEEIYYKDVVTNQWVENDVLILIDDVLIQIEAKAGAAATIASPAQDFKRHIQAVQDLIIKAYKQCKRFFDYLKSADEVPVFKRIDNKYVECVRLKWSNYRLMFPIGLTVEAFTPFSSICKELPDIHPILEKYPFISLSIDDLFVLKRLLPTLGELVHYLSVRQTVAGIKRAYLFDELDHLGAYIQKNRFDQDILEQRNEDKRNLIIWDGMSKIVDDYFTKDDWKLHPIPNQNYPNKLLCLLNALDKAKAAKWLYVDNNIRDCDGETRKVIDKMLEKCLSSLHKYPSRHFSISGNLSLFFWLQRIGDFYSLDDIQNKAMATALSLNTPHMIGIIIMAQPNGDLKEAKYFELDIPTKKTKENAYIYEEAERIKNKQQPISTICSTQPAQNQQRIGRNAPCWCGSGIKFKKCHG